MITRIDLRLKDGTHHSAVLSSPPKSKEKLPVFIVLGGFETGEKVLDLLPRDVQAIFAVVDYPYKVPNQRGFVRDLGQISQIKTAVKRTDLALDALVENLEQSPCVDRKRMTITGASFGAPFAITAAVRHRELSGVILIHAFGRVDAAIKQQLLNAWGNWSRPIAWAAGWLVWKILDYASPEVEVTKLHQHQRVLLIYSDEDDQLPQESVSSIVEGLQKSLAQKTVLKNRGGHLGPGKVEMIAEILDMSLQWLQDQNLMTHLRRRR